VAQFAKSDTVLTNCAV